MNALPDRPLQVTIISSAFDARKRLGLRPPDQMHSDVTYWASTATIRALYAESALREPDAPDDPTDRELREMPCMMLGSPVKIDDHLDYGEIRASACFREHITGAALLQIDPDVP